MKKTIALVALLSILSVFSFYVIGEAVTREKTNVTIKENVIYGDKSYADGVTVTTRASYDDHLFWDTAYTISATPKTTSDFEFYYSEHYEAPQRSTNGIVLDLDLKHGYDLRKSASESKGLQKAYRELYDSIPQGSSGSKTIKLQDYYDYLPIRVALDIPGVSWNGNDYDNLTAEYKNERAVWEKFNEYFKIPIPKDLPEFVISVSKGYDSIGMSGFILDFYFNTQTAYTGNKIYFSIRNKYYHIEEEKEERYVDTSMIPGGYGIYSLDYSYKNKADYNVDYQTGIEAESLTTVYPLEQHQEVIRLMMSNDQTKLLMFTQEQSEMYLTVIDVATMSQIQKIRIGALEQYSFNDYDNYIVIRGIYKIAVIEKLDSGLCNLAFVADRNPEIDVNHYFTGYATAMAFDGQRLVIIERSENQRMRAVGTCDFEVAVYTSDGLVYFGLYESSLSSYSINSPSDCDLVGYCVKFE